MVLWLTQLDNFLRGGIPGEAEVLLEYAEQDEGQLQPDSGTVSPDVIGFPNKVFTYACMQTSQLPLEILGNTSHLHTFLPCPTSNPANSFSLCMQRKCRFYNNILSH